MREVEILKKKQLKCYLYTRVSTSMQVDGYSLDAQRDKLRKYAAYEDMIVAGEYSVFTIHPSFLHKSKKIHVA